MSESRVDLAENTESLEKAILEEIESLKGVVGNLKTDNQLKFSFNAKLLLYAKEIQTELQKDNIHLDLIKAKHKDFVKGFQEFISEEKSEPSSPHPRKDSFENEQAFIESTKKSHMKTKSNADSLLSRESSLDQSDSQDSLLLEKEISAIQKSGGLPESLLNQTKTQYFAESNEEKREEILDNLKDLSLLSTQVSALNSSEFKPEIRKLIDTYQTEFKKLIHSIFQSTHIPLQAKTDRVDILLSTFQTSMGYLEKINQKLSTTESLLFHLAEMEIQLKKSIPRLKSSFSATNDIEYTTDLELLTYYNNINRSAHALGIKSAALKPSSGHHEAKNTPLYESDDEIERDIFDASLNNLIRSALISRRNLDQMPEFISRVRGGLKPLLVICQKMIEDTQHKLNVEFKKSSTLNLEKCEQITREASDNLLFRIKEFSRKTNKNDLIGKELKKSLKIVFDNDEKLEDTPNIHTLISEYQREFFDQGINQDKELFIFLSNAILEIKNTVEEHSSKLFSGPYSPSKRFKNIITTLEGLLMEAELSLKHYSITGSNQFDEKGFAIYKWLNQEINDTWRNILEKSKKSESEFISDINQAIEKNPTEKNYLFPRLLSAVIDTMNASQSQTPTNQGIRVNIPITQKPYTHFHLFLLESAPSKAAKDSLNKHSY